MLPEIFCPNCQTYLLPSTAQCACGWRRAISPPTPGEALWQAKIPGPAQHVVFADDLAIFTWGQRRAAKGGLAAFHAHTGQLTWAFETAHAVIGSITPFNGRLYFATLGFMGGEARLYCIESSTGEEIWSSAVSGGVWGQPLLREACIYLGSDDGRVSAFDLASGQPLANPVMQLPKGRVWLAQVDDLLIGLSQTGQVMAYNLARFAKAWRQPLDTGSPIASRPVVAGNQIFFGAEDGRLLALEARQRSLETFAQGSPPVIAPPAITDSRVYLGGRDHHLRAFERKSGLELWCSQEFAHSISVSPVVWENWVGVCVNQKGFYLLDQQDGSLVWKFELGGGVKLFSPPGVHQSLFYLGTDTGQIYALPWHLGRYAWAAEQRQVQKRDLDAGSYYVAAGWNAPLQESKDYFEKAINAWYQSDHPEWVAYLLENDITASPERCAQAYQRAGELVSHRHSALAKNLLLTAAEWYEEIEDEVSARHCRRMASRSTRGPHIQIKPVSVPGIWQEDQYLTTIVELKNRGDQIARQVWVRFAGDVKNRVWVEIADMPPKACIEVEVPLMAHSLGNLVIETRFQDHEAIQLRTSRRFEIQDVKPFEGILIEGSVAWMELKDIPGKVIVRGDVAILKAGVENSATPGATCQKCPYCNEPVPNAAKFCDKCGQVVWQ